nr:MAG TPA: hypothetical protein [Caudoviricetes sp.]
MFPYELTFSIFFVFMCLVIIVFALLAEYF